MDRPDGEPAPQGRTNIWVQWVLFAIIAVAVLASFFFDVPDFDALHCVNGTTGPHKGCP